MSFNAEGLLRDFSLSGIDLPIWTFPGILNTPTGIEKNPSVLSWKDTFVFYHFVEYRNSFIINCFTVISSSFFLKKPNFILWQSLSRFSGRKTNKPDVDVSDSRCNGVACGDLSSSCSNTFRKCLPSLPFLSTAFGLWIFVQVTHFRRSISVELILLDVLVSCDFLNISIVCCIKNFTIWRKILSPAR